MPDEVTSGEIRTRRFDVVRKGYDRNQVESFLVEAARQIDVLVTRIAEAPDTDLSVGIDDAEARAREWEAIGVEVDAILKAARSAAEGMRSRASADVETWTSEADTQAYAARESAWTEGSAMLAVAIEEAKLIVAEADTDALRIRAEAEREAIRYTADAKRTGEEVIGVAENEAEGILASSRAESERVVRAANQSAELAQERARTLEDRRAELLVELESKRSSIGDLETEMESKRQELEEPEPVVAPEYDERTHHALDSGSVKIVSASHVVPLRPVDADSFVAEVAEMRRSAEMEQTPDTRYQMPDAEPQPDEDGAETSDAEGGGRTADSDEQPSALSQEESRQPSAVSRQPEEEQPEEAQPEEEPGDTDSSLPQLTGGDVEDEDSSQLTAHSRQPDEELSEEPEPAEDSIGSLFAQLREDSQQDSSQPTADSQQPEEDRSQLTVDSSQSEHNGEGPTEVSSLIPVQNAALRSIKRTLVDLQNDALENLRTDTAWVPGEDFTDQFTEPFDELTAAITGDGDDGGAASVFATDLYDAVSSAVVATREAGSGDRAIAAATSKVFRTWRSDEAERRVVAAASALSERG